MCVRVCVEREKEMSSCDEEISYYEKETNNLPALYFW